MGELTEGGSVDVAAGVAVAVAVAVGFNGFGAAICTPREIQYSGFLPENTYWELNVSICTQKLLAMCFRKKPLVRKVTLCTRQYPFVAEVNFFLLSSQNRLEIPHLK